MQNRLPQMNSLQGHLLIASPHMDDPRFARTVILVLRHDQDGALGIVLNRPMQSADEDNRSSLIDLLSSDDGRIQAGGPVDGPLIVLHAEQQTSSGTKGGVFVIEKAEQLKHLIEEAEAPLQFYVGHAGWSPGQLERELSDGVWLSTPAVPDFVFAQHADMWVDAMRESGRNFYRDVLGISGFPDDPELN